LFGFFKKIIAMISVYKFVYDGKKFGEKIAEFHSIESKLFLTAIAEGGLGHEHVLIALRMLKEEGLSYGEAWNELLPYLDHGLNILESRFGKQSNIDEIRKLITQSCAQSANEEISLKPGETNGINIGCYFFGFEFDGGEPSIQSVATTRDELKKDIMNFFMRLEADILARNYYHPGNQDAVDKINYLKYNIDNCISEHLSKLGNSNSDALFLSHL
jgi:hypothetical protein